MSDTLTGDAQIAEALIGEDAERFVASELGQVILGFAQQEVEAARNEWEQTDPADAKKMSELQFKAKFGREFQAWLIELIEKGAEARKVIKDGSSN